MHSFVPYCLLALGGAVFALPTPSSHPPSGTINRRLTAPPPPGSINEAEPSPYPGGDEPCTNEPQYVNFDYSKEADRAMDTVINHEDDRTLFERYFSDAYVDEEEKEWLATDSISNINTLLYNADPDVKAAQPLVKTFIFDNEDFEYVCQENDPNSDNEDAKLTGAYSAYRLGTTRVHFCEASLQFAALSSIKCESLDAAPSIAMESTGRIMYHEFLHHPSVDQNGPDNRGGPAKNAFIDDLLNLDDKKAYYPERVHGLRDTEQDNLSDEAPWNADNYAWLAANAYFKYFCQKNDPPPPNKGNFNAPAHYTSGQQVSVP